MPSDPLRVLSLSCVYPNALEPSAGLFVRARLQHLAELVDIRVIAPVPMLDYARGLSPTNGRRRIQSLPIDRSLEVLHPRWLYPPGGSFLNPVFLFLRLLRPVSRLRASFPFDLIDSHFAYPDGIAAALLSVAVGRPFMVTLRGSELLHGQSRSKRWLMGWALRRAALVVTMSAELSRFATGLGAAASKVHTIPNGVDGTVFFPQDRTQARLKHRLPADAKVILSAGHLIELKCHHHVIQALHKLRQDGLDAHLLIAGGPGGGGPSWEDRLHRLASALGMADAIRFLGPVDQTVLAELMAAADVFCLASAREGCPNVVNEAMACGTPVVATRVGAVPMLIPSEQYGFIVPAQDEAALYQALQQALQKPWDHALIAARGQSRSWRQVALELLAQIRQAIPPV